MKQWNICFSLFGAWASSIASVQEYTLIGANVHVDLAFGTLNVAIFEVDADIIMNTYIFLI